MTFRAAVPGLLVLVTDGLWRHLPEARDLARTLGADAGVGIVAGIDPTRAATLLADAARAAGGLDDLTVAVLSSGATAPPGRPGG